MSCIRGAGLVLLLAAFLGAAGCSSTVEIGAVVSESGAAQIYGVQVKNGLDLALEEINAEGGFKGKPFHLIYKDDQTKADVGIEAVESLINEHKVRLIIGATSSTVTLKIAPICESHKTVLLSPSASAPKITEAGSYIFRNYPSDILEGTSMADFARDIGLERLVVFAVNNEFGNGLRDIFSEKYPSKFRKILKTFDFDENETDSFRPMIQETKKLKPDGIYIVGYVTDMAELVKQLRGAGCKAIIMGASSVTEDIVQLAGSTAENLVYPRPGFDINSEDEAMSSFVQAYRAKYGEDPGRFAAHGYDSLKLMLKAMENGGSDYPDHVKLGLMAIDNYPGASGRVTFDQNGDMVQYPRLFIIHEGQPVQYEKFIEGGGELPIPGRN